LYKSTYIDLSDAQAYTAIDTAFSLSVATLFAQLVEIKDADGREDALPDYETISRWMSSRCWISRTEMGR
jgi:hypothetical protein